MFIRFKRAVTTAYKDLQRNKGATFSSIAVMSLVFLVFSVFSLFAYASVKFLHYVETREHLEVFFNTETPEQKILEIKAELEQTGKTSYVTYTDQEQAAEYLRERHSDNPLILGAITPEALPASLAIRAKKIDYITELNAIVENQDPDGSLIYKISYNEDTTNLLKDLLFWVRLIGAIVFTVLVVVIFLVSLITVEISITSRSEEISIMQLVGGGKWFIRFPFILQGAFYGFMGAIIAATIISVLGIAFHILRDQSPTLSFISNFFSDISLPKLTPLKILAFYGIEMALGFIVGGINSTVAVLRHLK